MKDRVKFYSRKDVCYGLNLERIKMIEINSITDMTINDAIEFHEIKKYFDDGVQLNEPSDEEIIKLNEKSDMLERLCKQYFTSISDDNVVTLYGNIELGYNSQFWELFDICKLYNKISEPIFCRLIDLPRISPYDLLKYKGVVKKYGKIIREYILNNDFCVPVLLHIYEQDYTNKEKLILPTELTGEEIRDYLERYIDSEHPNTNYLIDIEHMSETKAFPITDEIRLKAKRRYDAEVKKIFEEGVSAKFGYQIQFDPTQEEVILVSCKDNESCISYSTKWLEETLDYPSILNNFIYIFEFADVLQMRSLLVTNKTETGVFERVLLSDSTRFYCCNNHFNALQTISSMQMAMYYNFLSKNNIELESVLHWFFTEYLQNEFSCPEIRVSFPSEKSTFLEKCSSIVTAFETILKQYVLFVRNGDIDFDLVTISTKPTLFKDIGSIVENKYIYGNGDEYNQFTNILFSNQCLLSYVERIHEAGRRYDSLYDLILNEEVCLHDYREREQKTIEFLVKNDFVVIDENDRIMFKDKRKIIILRDLYKNEVISRNHYPLQYQNVFDELLKKGILYSESTLFTRPEIDYLNYLLNRSEYVNGLEIRNKYIHGMQHVKTDDSEHMKNYFIFLKIFILLAIKINDEFILKEEQKKAKK